MQGYEAFTENSLRFPTSSPRLKPWSAQLPAAESQWVPRVGEPAAPIHASHTAVPTVSAASLRVARAQEARNMF
jgi:hypothetical protein